MKTKTRDNSRKPITSKKKVVRPSSQYYLKELKKAVRTKQNFTKSDQFSRSNLFGRAFAFIVIMVVMVAAYIYIEDPAQAEPQKQNQLRMQIIYELYNGPTTYYKKQVVRDVLLASGVKNNLCAEIAETIVEESNKTNIPVEMYLAIMKKESTFRSKAVSSSRAKGIMQIQGGTWDAYVEKHNLPVTKEHIFLPQANIMVASVILKELYDYYAKLGYQEPEIWNYVLAAYYAGPASVKNGIKGYHWRYIEKVKQYYNEFELEIAA
jgi:soluble lytic murein transglycosylase-like protein